MRQTRRESKCKVVHGTEWATALQKHNLLHGTPLERCCRITASQTCQLLSASCFIDLSAPPSSYWGIQNFRECVGVMEASPCPLPG